jgi:nucleoid DNA-binding protein
MHHFGSVRVSGLVTIKRECRGERLVRNPRTGAEFLMGPSTLVKAKSTIGCGDRVKGENPASH